MRRMVFLSSIDSLIRLKSSSISTLSSLFPSLSSLSIHTSIHTHTRPIHRHTHGPRGLLDQQTNGLPNPVRTDSPRHSQTGRLGDGERKAQTKAKKQLPRPNYCACVVSDSRLASTPLSKDGIASPKQNGIALSRTPSRLLVAPSLFNPILSLPRVRWRCIASQFRRPPRQLAFPPLPALFLHRSLFPQHPRTPEVGRGSSLKDVEEFSVFLGEGAAAKTEDKKSYFPGCYQRGLPFTTTLVDDWGRIKGNKSFATHTS
ncbi:hypothetical protein EDB81DRAFT_383093 [Dactylonectria macrodidyma]|uniref:Uncharacterized protein n=1 Tax=Dactylonectria macrodidyma TaxID=307937 RepID=A0A9P9FA74_9HYPO|nr:hypothetical protein EDB81DRAFT_383093 [Dactylonectria macrodidyma]